MPRFKDWLAELRKPKNKFSLEHMQYLHNILVKNPTINAKNQTLIVETLRQIAELVIWGDQHNEQFFDFFLEKNILSFFLNILNQNCSVAVKVQLIQTLSILVENLRSEIALFYLFSNNHVNELIQHKFDFGDEEVVAYYISFLKTLSLKLNPKTIQFFFNEHDGDFPLYTEAIKFFNSRESMVRVAVRTLTLNVLRVEDSAMRRFVNEKTAAPFCSNLVWYVADQTHGLERQLAKSSPSSWGILSDLAEELLDQFFYLNDVLCLNGITGFNVILSYHLCIHYMLPVLLMPVSGNPCSASVSSATGLFILAQLLHIINDNVVINVLASHLVLSQPRVYLTRRDLLLEEKLPKHLPVRKRRPTYGRSLSGSTRAADLRVAMDALTRATSEVRDVSSATVSDSSAIQRAASPPAISPKAGGMEAIYGRMEKPRASSELSRSQGTPSIYSTNEDSLSERDGEESDLEAEQGDEDEVDLKNLSCRDALFAMLTSEDDRCCLGALCVLHALVKNSATDRKLLEAADLFPVRLTKAKLLLGDLLDTPSSNALNALLDDENDAKKDCFGDVDDNDEESSVVCDKLVKKLSSVSSDGGSLFGGKGGGLRDSIFGNSDEENDEMDNASADVEGSEGEAANGGRCQRAIDAILQLLTRFERHRIITLQMAIMILKDLAFSEERPAHLSREQREKAILLCRYLPMILRFSSALVIPLKEAIYYKARSDLRSKLIQSSLGDVCLELFEDEMRGFKQINFEYMVTDVSILLPVPKGATPGFDFSRRFPSGAVEDTRKAIRHFLLFREFYFTLLNEKDDMLPLKETRSAASSQVTTGSVIDISQREYVSCRVTGRGVTDRFLVEEGWGNHTPTGCNASFKPADRLLQGLYLLITEPTTKEEVNPLEPPNPADDSLQKEKAIVAKQANIEDSSDDLTDIAEGEASTPKNVVIVDKLPLQNVEAAINKSDPTLLLMKTGSLVFDNEDKCKSAKLFLDSCKHQVRQDKMDQLFQLLDIEASEMQRPASKRLSTRESKPAMGGDSVPAASPPISRRYSERLVSSDVVSNQYMRALVAEEEERNRIDRSVSLPVVARPTTGPTKKGHKGKKDNLSKEEVIEGAVRAWIERGEDGKDDTDDSSASHTEESVRDVEVQNEEQQEDVRVAEGGDNESKRHGKEKVVLQKEKAGRGIEEKEEPR